MPSLRELILRLDDSVSYVAVLDECNAIVECSFRDDAHAEVPSELMRKFVSLTPLIILGSVDRLREFYGNVNFVTARLGDHIIAFFEVKDQIIFLILGTSDFERIERIRDTLLNLLEKDIADLLT
jgi:hypothetical protein